MMAYRWLSLLVVVTLLQGVLLLSPIPVPDKQWEDFDVHPIQTAEEEWEQYNELLINSDYRLPRTTVPEHYVLSLTPYFEHEDENRTFTFDGKVKINIKATTEGVNELIMHCNDLTVKSVTVQYTDVNNEIKQIASPNQSLECEMPYSFLRISTTEDLQQLVTYEVDMEFTGRLQSNMRGFYRSWYIDSTTKRWMATTQFQPGHARQAFPCYDEPGFKATFDITINREPEFSPTISNMPIKTTSLDTETGRVSETFYTTPRTSTYLLAFIVSHYAEIESKPGEDRPFRIYARDNAGITGKWALDVGIDLLREMEEYTQIPYYTMAENMDMKQAAIPDFSAGAMENWGLLTYREALILYDPENSNHFYKQRVANIISHEIAHMWFGNLVTCAWWDNLWLNEGFARFYQYYLTGKVAPELGYGTRFIVEQFEQAMSADSVDTAHALTNLAVSDPTTVSAHFSSITYARGACILRMTEHLLSYETFVKGLRRYLQERKYDVAEPHHLFEALDVAAEEDGALNNYGGITIDQYFRSWSEKAGHPLLTVTIDQATGEMIIKQARWERTSGQSIHPSLWNIPITWARAGAADFVDLKPSQFITDETTVIQRGTTGNEWVVFNKQASGFYRINYDSINWALITQALRSDVTVIHEYNRAQIIDDLFNFGRAGVLPYDRVFNTMSFLEFDDQYAPWINAITGFNFLIRRLAHDTSNLNKLQNVILQFSKAITARLGYVEIDEEPFMDGLLRMYVMQFLCNIGDQQCINTGKERFAAWRSGAVAIPANMRPWVYCVGLREGNAADFDFFWDKYLIEDLASEQVVMLQAAGCTSDQNSLAKFLNAIVDEEEIVRPQDLTTAFNSAVTRNEVNTLRVFEWLKNNVEKTAAKFESIATPLSYITPRLLTTDDIDQFENWLQENQDIIGATAYQTGISGVSNVRNSLIWSELRTPEIVEFLDNGYEEVDIPEVTEAPPNTTEAAEITTEIPSTMTEAAETTTEIPSTTTEAAETPTEAPTEEPTEAPTEEPTEAPTEEPTEAPTEEPTEAPTEEPTEAPTEEPTEAPTEEPTTPGEDGAATVVLSFAALTVSIVITFFNWI
ncbi:unnamed protein product [Diatraea saccharalis]|uniref:Aminopeptidase n=1 Tax=Diatraea saccharalis TaxID=40085 RepID=A0A9P0CC85_9NEOP|nr:unnamed protein product [Diatraea saccharalis]